MTLFGTSVVFTVTLFAWGGAKVACNLHPPPYQEFKPAPLTRLASTPKDGALEFHHRMSILDFSGAKELATNSARAIVDAAEAACDASCKARAESRRDGVVTRAIVLSREGTTAVVRAESFYQGEVESRTYEVTWEERLWKVVREAG